MNERLQKYIASYETKVARARRSFQASKWGGAHNGTSLGDLMSDLVHQRRALAAVCSSARGRRGRDAKLMCAMQRELDERLLSLMSEVARLQRFSRPSSNQKIVHTKHEPAQNVCDRMASKRRRGRDVPPRRC